MHVDGVTVEFGAAGCLLIASASTAYAQAPQLPKPTPEQEKLRYFVGDWSSEGDVKAGPMGPGGKYTATDHGEMLGDYFVVMHSDGNIPGMGHYKGTAIMSYDPKENVYLYDEYTSMAEHNISKGTVSGDTWTWTSTQEMGGKQMTGKFTEKILSPTAYAYKYEMTQDGTNWMSIVEGKATKK